MDGTVPSPRRNAFHCKLDRHKKKSNRQSNIRQSIHPCCQRQSEIFLLEEGNQIVRYNWDLFKCDLSLVWNAKSLCPPDFVLAVNVSHKLSFWKSKLLHPFQFQPFSKLSGVFTAPRLSSCLCVHRFHINFGL